MPGVKTYDPKQVIMSLGTHAVSGFSEDSFISIEKQGDGITVKVGCDGEMARSLDPNLSYKITLKLLQTSDTNAWLLNQWGLDNETGQGTFPVTIKDLSGTLVFNSEVAWAVKPTKYDLGKEATEREWEIDTGPASLVE